MSAINLFVSIICLILVISCTSPPRENDLGNVEKIISCVKKNWNLTDFFKLSEIVPLETNSECFITKIERAIVKNDRIYILDKEANAVFLFSREGKFLNKICKVGKGPAEYQGLVSIDVTDNAIYLLVWQSRQKLMRFDLDLNFVNEEVLPITCGAIKMVKNGLVCYANNSCNKLLNNNGYNHNFAFLNNQRKVEWESLPFLKSHCGYSNLYGITGGYNFTESSLGQVYFTKPFSDYIFKVNDQELSRSIKLKIDHEGLENAEHSMDKDDLYKYYQQDGLIKSIYNVFVGKNFMYFNTFIGDNSYKGLIQNNEAYICLNQGLDAAIGLHTVYVVGQVDKSECIISTISALHVSKLCNKPGNIVPEEVQEIGRNLNPNDNPILLFFEYKKLRDI